MPERGLNVGRGMNLVNPSFSAADTPLFCRALSVGVTFLCATSIYPGILNAILSSSFSVEANFVIARLVLACASHQLIVCNFFAVSPGMGQYGIRRKFVGVEGDQFKVDVRLLSQKAHPDGGGVSKGLVSVTQRRIQKF